MTELQIAHRRMFNQRLWGEACSQPADVVRGLTAMQAQEFPYAKWSVAQRCGAATRSVLDAAVEAGEILRTHVLRPTWHFVLPEDIQWLLDLTGPRINAMNASFYRNQGLDASIFAKSAKLFGKAVEGGAHRTRAELADLLRSNKLPCENLQVICLIMHAELDGILCSGASRGKQRTYASLRERAPNARRLHLDEALAELTFRYFSSHGPATVKDFRWWSSLTAAQAKAGLDGVKCRLEHEVIEGRTYWFDGSLASTTPPPESRVDLVQIYDECLMAYTESRHVIDDGNRGDGQLSHSILLNGRRIGSWKRVPESTTVQVQVNRRLGKAESLALDEAIERYSSYIEEAVSVVRT